MKDCALRFVAVAAACWLSGPATAQSYPNRAITIVVPFSVSTASDVLARTVGKQVGERLGASVVVDNRPGASGSIGNSMVAKAAPDGYTLLLAATSFIISKSLNPSLPFDPARNYSPVALLATGPVGLVVNSELPAQSVAEVVALAKSRPGRLFYASPGNGTIQHMSMELFKLETETNIVHVPYKEQSGALTDLVAGRTHIMITPLLGVMNLIQSGRVRLIGMLTSERAAPVPSVPTFKEAGFPTLEVAVWYGLLGPAGLPADVVGRLNKEINASLNQRDVRDVFEKQGLSPAGGSPERFAEWMRGELQRWPRVVARSGIKPD